MRVDCSQPESTNRVHPVDTGVSQLYQWMRTARCIDEIECELVARGEAFFQVSGAGHESSAALAPWLIADDYLHCHYRDKALLLARGMPIREFVDSLLCNDASHSGGRQMSAHLSAPPLHVMSMVGPVGNNALQAVGVAAEIKQCLSNALVVCSLGDGTTQQGEVLEAIAEAVRSTLPVLFLIQDNRYAISTRTAGRTFFSLPSGDADNFYGLPVHRVNGSDALACSALFQQQVAEIRRTRGPVLCVMQVERLGRHTNADDDSVYRSAEELRRARENSDPLLNLCASLKAQGMSDSEIGLADSAIALAVRHAADFCLDGAEPTVESACFVTPGMAQALEYRGSGLEPALTMADALRQTLHARLASEPRASLFGQDIEDPKGDVFGVTLGLSQAFPGRVCNAPLSESTIVGVSIGRALAGGRPVAFLQFADFIPLAFNQLASELAPMVWRTRGAWTTPVVVLVSCGAYRPGLGPFHAQTYESVVAHLPGIDIAMPSTAGDAAGILNAAFRSERPTVIFYPKALLNERSRMTTPDVARHWVPVGAARIVRPGNELTLVAWGNTVPLCESVAATLCESGASVDVIDLRWIAPWDADTVCASARKTGRLLVVHEDNRNAGFGAEVVATVSERLGNQVSCRRVARPDTFIPCHYGNQLDILPSYRSILEAAAEMLGFDVHWQHTPVDVTGLRVIPLLGSSPSDMRAELVELLVKVGDTVKAGQPIACVESDKAVMELASPADGVVEAIALHIGDKAAVGATLMTLAVGKAARRQTATQPARTAHLHRRATMSGQPPPAFAPRTVFLAGLGAVRGRARLGNHELAHRLPTLASASIGGDGIFERTGIEYRLVADAGQDAVSMAAEAAELALREANITAKDLSLVICSTSTPTMIAPSTACQVLALLGADTRAAAYDMLAACSGYLFALASAWDFLQQHPDAHVLVLTTETMRRIVDVDDPATSPIFGDAATATVVSASNGNHALASLHRPVLSAQADTDSALQVPLPGKDQYVHMDGKRIFNVAIKRMAEMLERACQQSRLAVADMDLIVPHQANGRMLEAMRLRLALPPERVWNEVRMHGNTSSSSIPLALDTVLRMPTAARRIGLCAFGAGFTFGGAVLDKPGRGAPD